MYLGCSKAAFVQCRPTDGAVGRVLCVVSRQADTSELPCRAVPVYLVTAVSSHRAVHYPHW